MKGVIVLGTRNKLLILILLTVFLIVGCKKINTQEAILLEDATEINNSEADTVRMDNTAMEVGHSVNKEDTASDSQADSSSKIVNESTKAEPDRRKEPNTKSDDNALSKSEGASNLNIVTESVSTPAQVDSKAAEDNSMSSDTNADLSNMPKESIGKYKDGAYKGLGIGREGSIEVLVTVKESKISSIEVLSHSDTPNLAKRVFRIITGEIIASQSLEVDSVSGATQTSKGFVDSVKDALKK